MPDGLIGGYTKLANNILEEITKRNFSKREYKVLLYIFRNGYGYNKEQSSCVREVRRIAHGTNMHRANLWKALHSLEDKQVVKLQEDAILFNRHFDEWRMDESIEQENGGRQSSHVVKTTTRDKESKQLPSVVKMTTKCSQNDYRDISNRLNDNELGALKEREKKEKTDSPPDSESHSAPKKEMVEQIVSFLNNVTGKSFKHSTPKTIKLIVSRMDEGFSLEDFQKVITLKSNEWMNDSKMNKYLRPETLFGTKFESYLQESEASPNTSDAFGFSLFNSGRKGYGL